MGGCVLEGAKATSIILNSKIRETTKLVHIASMLILVYSASIGVTRISILAMYVG